MAKNLVIYYSRKGENYFDGNIKYISQGNSEICAQYIKDAIAADLFEIDTVKEYSQDYMVCTQEAKVERDNNEHPKLKKYLEDISDYDNIFILGPCWWGTFPMAIFSQLEKLDFTGKTIAPLMTHEGSGLGSSESDLKKYCQGANLTKGLAIYGNRVKESKDIVANWAKNIAK